MAKLAFIRGQHSPCAEPDVRGRVMRVLAAIIAASFAKTARPLFRGVTKWQAEAESREMEAATDAGRAPAPRRYSGLAR